MWRVIAVRIDQQKPESYNLNDSYISFRRSSRYWDFIVDLPQLVVMVWTGPMTSDNPVRLEIWSKED